MSWSNKIHVRISYTHFVQYFWFIRRLKHFLVSLSCLSPTNTDQPKHVSFYTIIQGTRKEGTSPDPFQEEIVTLFDSFITVQKGHSEGTHAEENWALRNNVSELVPKKEFCDKRNNNNIHIEPLLVGCNLKKEEYRKKVPKKRPSLLLVSPKTVLMRKWHVLSIHSLESI